MLVESTQVSHSLLISLRILKPEVGGKSVPSLKNGLHRLRKNSARGRKDIPQGPDVFSIIYGTTKVVPLEWFGPGK
jgi:hypothetical protein